MSTLDRKIAELLQSNGIDWKSKEKLAVGIRDLVKNTGLQGLKDSYLNSDRLKNSLDCPLCEKKIQLRKVSLSKTICELLIKSYKIDKGGTKYFHAGNDVGVSYSVGGGYARLEYWGLIEPQTKDSSNSNSIKGMWCMTDRGRRFVEHSISLPKYVVVYNSNVRSVGVEMTDIIKEVGGDMKYNKLLNE